MPSGGRAKIGVESDRGEDLVGGEARPLVVISRRRGMEATEGGADRGGGVRIDLACGEFLFPYPKARRFQIGHREASGRVVSPEQARHAGGEDAGRHGEPVPFVPISGGRHLPEGIYFEPGERSLHADRTAGQLDPPDV